MLTVHLALNIHLPWANAVEVGIAMAVDDLAFREVTRENCGCTSLNAEILESFYRLESQDQRT
jgi:hypothetical protein